MSGTGALGDRSLASGRGGQRRRLTRPFAPGSRRPRQGADDADRLAARIAELEAQLAALAAERQQAEGELRQNQALLQAIIDHAPHSIVVQDLAEGRYLLVNRRQEELTGRGRDELVGRTLAEVLPAQAVAWREQDRRIAASGEPLQLEDVKRHADGREQFFLGLKFPLRDATGEVYAIGGIFQEITARKEMERALRESEDRYRSVVEALEEGVLVLDDAGLIRAANPSAARLLGVAPEALRDRPLADLCRHAMREDGSPLPAEEHPAQRALATGEPHPGTVMGFPPSADGMTRWLAVNARPLQRAGEARPYGVVSSFADITARRALEDHLRHRATHDPLTGLPNRDHFLASLARVLTPTTGTPRTVGVLYLDLDHFKAVNDRLGHAAGDALLVAVAARLRVALREDNLAARLGGDEFTVCLPLLAGGAEAVRVARRLLRALGAPYTIEGRQLRVTPSIGIAIGATGVHTLKDLLRRADAALYRAKALGRGRCEIAEEEKEAAICP